MTTYKLGHYNTLSIIEFGEHGALLDGGDCSILMPRKYVSPTLKTGDKVDVFVYLDQEDRLVATTENALAQVGDFAFLKVAWTNNYGAFLNWGLTKDLFVPFKEQGRKMVKDLSYLVYIYIDEQTGRIVATTKLDRYIHYETTGIYQEGQAVNAIIWKQTDIGFKVIVDKQYGGLIYKNEIFQPLHVGDTLEAYIKTVRPDGKLDIALQRNGKEHITDFSEQLLQILREEGGFLPLTDNSSPEEISRRLSVSKKTYKKAVGALYKKRLISIEENGIRLL